MGCFAELEQRGKIAIVHLNNPDSLNAIGSLEDCDDLVATLETIGGSNEISVMILTGRGRAFCSGGNLRAIKERNGIGPLDQPDSTRSNYRRGVQRITRAFMDLEVPAIAAINGPAVGLGLDLACLCEVRIVSEAARMSASFIKVGIVPGDGGAWSLSQIIGYSKAAELLLTGDSFGAQEALAMGLVSKITKPESLIAEAMAVAERMATNPPRALRLTKRLLRQAQHQSMADVLELSAAFQAIIHETADHVEAVDALLEKRPPRFTGQ
jgi:2-(1,2-epoxy-1,2-dihydrophenyl)acetyl-CoA isomerase